MSKKPEKLIQDLIMFYVKENYNNYLLEHNITIIPEEELESVIENLYSQRKDHLKGFIKESLKKIMKDEYIGDLVVNNLLIDIFRDDKLCKNRIKIEISEYQKNKSQ
tara:strand:- start:536 stop:856 length:321 start_codon:yes stop_codon:yes gene_type:complete